MSLALSASASAASDLSQISSAPTRFSGRVDSLTLMFSKPNAAYVSYTILIQPLTSSRICSSVQKMWASSCVKPRTRIRPCSAPDGSLRWQQPNSAIRRGRSRYDFKPWLKICTWPGQFIGLTAYSRFSDSVVNMFSAYLSQWPDFSQSERSIINGPFTSS